MDHQDRGLTNIDKSSFNNQEERVEGTGGLFEILVRKFKVSYENHKTNPFVIGGTN